MQPWQTAVSFELLDRLARRGDAFALGSIALHLLRTTRAADGTPDPRAVALVIGAAAAGCQRCSRFVVVFASGGWSGWSMTAERLEFMWRIHRRNERRFEGRVAAAKKTSVPAAVVTLHDR